MDRYVAGIILMVVFLAGGILFLLYYLHLLFLGVVFRRAAKKHGLSYGPSSLFFYPSIAGKIRGRAVHVGVGRNRYKRYLLFRTFYREKNRGSYTILGHKGGFKGRIPKDCSHLIHKLPLFNIMKIEEGQVVISMPLLLGIKNLSNTIEVCIELGRRVESIHD